MKNIHIYVGVLVLIIILALVYFHNIKNDEQIIKSDEIQKITIEHGPESFTAGDKSVIKDIIDYLDIKEWKTVKNWRLELAPSFYMILHYSDNNESILGFLEDEEIAYCKFKNRYYKLSIKYSYLKNYLNKLLEE
ncbi:hypothetical protein SH1V18_38020 [Vallitalea longa]|uniref:Uncharacterized protein n=1 Tax=Vallitalea longa TaxID=2936439 RepID=A0A9W6DH90_9FIRM|nr:hypothetical protein [Vallitalea longa]GKX31322.1 hypothetical protein SH1V18_38020 [Vallitalea longa]